MILIHWTLIFTIQMKPTLQIRKLSPPNIADTDDTCPKKKRQNYPRKGGIVLCRSFINLSKNSMEGMEETLEIFLRDVHTLLGEFMVKGTKPRDSIHEIWSQKSIMNRLK